MRPLLCAVPFIAAFTASTSILAWPTYAQAPTALLHTLSSPSVAPQIDDNQGFSVAIDGKWTVVGCPDDDIGAGNSGVAKVYDTYSGELRYVLLNPYPGWDARFGYSVAVSGDRVVCGSPNLRHVTIYDLASHNPRNPVFDFPIAGRSVAISGSRVAVETSTDVKVYDLSTPTPLIPIVSIQRGQRGGNTDGRTIAISPLYLVWGTADDSYFHSGRSGEVSVYDLQKNGAPLVAKLTNPVAIPRDDEFGKAVALAGSRIVVGAPSAGRVFVFDLETGTPSVPTVTLTNPPGFFLNFGDSVAVSEKWVVGGSIYGGVAAFDLASDQAEVPRVRVSGSGEFGFSVAISGDDMVVGDKYGITPGRGAAYVYNLSNSTPVSPTAVMNSPSPATDDQFGLSVAVSGAYAIVGAPFDDTVAGNAGSAYVYNLGQISPSTSSITLSNVGGNADDRFGYVVDIDKNLIAVGAQSYRPSGGVSAPLGAVFVYDLNSDESNIPTATIINPNLAGNDNFAEALAIEGTALIVGAASAGRAYLYDVASGTPNSPVSTLTNPTRAFDIFGRAVAISSSWIAVGAPFNDLAGNDAGCVYVYRRDDLSRPFATILNPKPESNRYFGWKLDLSNSRLVAGSSYFSHEAYVFDLSRAALTNPVATLAHLNPNEGRICIYGSRVSFDNYLFDIDNSDPSVPIAKYEGAILALDETRVITGFPPAKTELWERAAVYVFGPEFTLAIRSAVPGIAAVSWTPFSSIGGILQYADSPFSSNWINLNLPLSTLNSFAVPTTNRAGFFRLVRP